jgi:hypothetical protein
MTSEAKSIQSSPAALAGFEFLFADDARRYKNLFVEISYRGEFVALVTAENSSEECEVEWPEDVFLPRCRRIGLTRLLEALQYGAQTLRTRLAASEFATDAGDGGA